MTSRVDHAPSGRRGRVPRRPEQSANRTVDLLGCPLLIRGKNDGVGPIAFAIAVVIGVAVEVAAYSDYATGGFNNADPTNG